MPEPFPRPWEKRCTPWCCATGRNDINHSGGGSATGAKAKRSRINAPRSSDAAAISIQVCPDSCCKSLWLMESSITRCNKQPPRGAILTKEMSSWWAVALDTDAAVARASSTPQRASERDKHLKRFFFFSSGKLNVLEGVVVVESHDVKIFKHLVFPSCQTCFSDGFLCYFE